MSCRAWNAVTSVTSSPAAARSAFASAASAHTTETRSESPARSTWWRATSTDCFVEVGAHHGGCREGPGQADRGPGLATADVEDHPAPVEPGGDVGHRLHPVAHPEREARPVQLGMRRAARRRSRRLHAARRGIGVGHRRQRPGHARNAGRGPEQVRRALGRHEHRGVAGRQGERALPVGVGVHDVEDAGRGLLVQPLEMRSAERSSRLPARGRCGRRPRRCSRRARAGGPARR